MKSDHYADLLGWWALKVFLPVAPSLFSVQVNVSGGCKAVASSLATMEIQSAALRLTGVLVRKNKVITRAVRDIFKKRSKCCSSALRFKTAHIYDISSAPLTTVLP